LYDQQVSFKKVTKWVVANGDQVERLDKIYDHAKALNVPIHYQSKEQCLKGEPRVKADVALVLPETGILNSHELMESLLFEFESNGGDAVFHTKVIGMERDGDGYRVELISHGEPVSIQAMNVINAAGLYSDKIAAMVLPESIVPKLYFAKGHYYTTNKKVASRLIYPIPCKNITSLGLHLTIDMGGMIKFGPDVLFQESRSDYSFQGDVDLAVKEISGYIHGIEKHDLQEGYTGIRPKLAAPGGTFEDFLIEQPIPGFVNLMGIESPGLTSTLAIAEYVEDLLY
jgi:L-2-hydroxyglutarate oxidase LhgO